MPAIVWKIKASGRQIALASLRNRSLAVHLVSRKHLVSTSNKPVSMVYLHVAASELLSTYVGQ